MKEDIIKTVFGALGGAAVWLFGGWDAALITLAVFIALDYLTGTIKAGIKKELNSSTGFVGLARKGAMLLVVIVAAQIDRLTGQPVFRTMACMFYIANEGISILENSAEIGIPLPSALLSALQKIKAKAEEKAPVVKEIAEDEVYKPPN